MQMALAGFEPQVLDLPIRLPTSATAARSAPNRCCWSLGRRARKKCGMDPHCEVVCHFCHNRYQFDLNDLVEKAVSRTKIRRRTNMADENWPPSVACIW